MNTPILDSTEYDINAASCHSIYSHDTNRKLDTLFANWTFEDAIADFAGYSDDKKNARADAALARYNAAKEEAQFIKVAAAMAEEADIEATTFDASIYGQGG